MATTTPAACTTDGSGSAAAPNPQHQCGAEAHIAATADAAHERNRPKHPPSPVATPAAACPRRYRVGLGRLVTPHRIFQRPMRHSRMCRVRRPRSNCRMPASAGCARARPAHSHCSTSVNVNVNVNVIVNVSSFATNVHPGMCHRTNTAFTCRTRHCNC